MNIGYTDAEADEEIEGVGTFGAGFILASRSNTYLLSFTDEPRSKPDLVSNEFGCIAPNTFVEFDGGTAWISSRGPVAMTGDGMQWVGRDLEYLFIGSRARYKKDSQGRMRHAWGAHDPDRGLVIFGMLADLDGSVEITDHGEDYSFADATDKLRSRFPCDELLVWSYRANAWSRWTMPAGLEVLWMERDVDVQGVGRLLFLAADKRIYAMDDEFADSNVDPVVVTATDAGVGVGPVTMTGVLMGGTVDDREDDTFVRAGMTVLQVRNNNLVQITTVYDFTSTTLTVLDGITWEVGDEFIIGAHVATLETNFFSTMMQNRRISKISLVESLSSYSPNTEAVTNPTLAFLKTEVIAGRRFFDADGQAATITKITSQVDETYDFMPMGVSADEADTSVHNIILSEGSNEGDTLAMRVTIAGAARVRICDILLETT